MLEERVAKTNLFSTKYCSTTSHIYKITSNPMSSDGTCTCVVMQHGLRTSQLHWIEKLSWPIISLIVAEAYHWPNAYWKLEYHPNIVTYYWIFKSLCVRKGYNLPPTNNIWPIWCVLDYSTRVLLHQWSNTLQLHSIKKTIRCFISG